MKTKQIQQKRMLAMMLLLTLSSFIGIFAQSVGSTFTISNCVRWARGTAESGYVNMTFKVLSTESNTVEGYWPTMPDPFYAKYITEIEIPEYVTYNNRTWRVSSIGEIKLYHTNNFVKAILPELLETLGDGAFYNFGYKAFEIVGAETVRKIGREAFYKCQKNTSLIDLTHVEEIGRAAFFMCDSLHVVHLPSIKKLAPTAFMFVQQGAPGKTSKGLYEIVLGSDLEEIPDSCFWNQSALQVVEISSNINRIGKKAFRNCCSLSYIELPSGLTQIDDSAFQYCYKLDTLVVHSNTPPSLGSNVFLNCPKSILYVPYGCKSAYQAANYWNGFKEIVEMEQETIMATDITLNQSTLPFNAANQTATLTATVTPANATNKSVTWNSSNTAVATVDANGKVTAVADGTATITATTVDGTNLSATCEVTVAIPVPATGISLNNTMLNLTAVGQTATLTATVTPANATNKSVTWTSSNTAVATVDANGKVTAVADGTATITATTADGTNLSATCEVTVAIPVPATGISLNNTMLNLTAVGQTATLTATVTPSNATNKSVTWTSSNTAVATVSSTGVVTAQANGNATIIANTADGTNLTATCTVTVAISSFITFADGNVKTICVANWDTSGDGELSEEEAADVTSLGEVFRGNTEITSFDEISYFTGLTGFDDDAFNGCSGLTSFTIPSNITSIGRRAFESCSSLTSITIPESVTDIYYHAFSYCTGITSITVDPGNGVYDSRYDCNAIIKTTANQLVAGCKNTIIPDNVTRIGNYAFCGCSGLTSITIPESVTAIGNSAFYDCSNLTSITIPNSVTSIEAAAFSGCNSLTSVTVEMSTPLVINENVFSNRANATLYVPAGSKANYEAADYWKQFGTIVEMVGLYSVNHTANRGAEFDLPVLMENGNEAITAFQFDVVLPEGVTLLSAKLSDRKADHGNPVPTLQNDGSYRLTTFSGSGSAFSGSEGTLLNLRVKVSTDAALGEHTVTLKNIELTTTSQAFELDNRSSTITVLDVLTGDASGDGKVSIFDAVQIVNYILGNTPETFLESAADIDGNGKITIFDAVLTVNIILNQGSTNNARITTVDNEREPQ